MLQFMSTFVIERWVSKKIKSNLSVKICLLIFPNFQVRSLGARIDLRTLIHGLLHRPQIRAIMTSAQKSRTLYYHMRLCGIILETYKSIRLTFIDAYLREFQKRKSKRSKGYWNSYSDTRNPYYVKNLFGKIIQEYFKNRLAKLFKAMRIQNKNLFGENLFGEITNSLDYRDKTRNCSSAIRKSDIFDSDDSDSTDYIFIGIFREWKVTYWRNKKNLFVDLTKKFLPLFVLPIGGRK